MREHIYDMTNRPANHDGTQYPQYNAAWFVSLFSFHYIAFAGATDPFMLRSQLSIPFRLSFDDAVILAQVDTTAPVTVV